MCATVLFIHLQPYQVASNMLVHTQISSTSKKNVVVFQKNSIGYLKKWPFFSIYYEDNSFAVSAKKKILLLFLPPLRRDLLEE